MHGYMVGHELSRFSGGACTGWRSIHYGPTVGRWSWTINTDENTRILDTIYILMFIFNICGLVFVRSIRQTAIVDNVSLDDDSDGVLDSTSN